jgi:hypothetical protein
MNMALICLLAIPDYSFWDYLGKISRRSTRTEIEGFDAVRRTEMEVPKAATGTGRLHFFKPPKKVPQ